MPVRDLLMSTSGASTPATYVDDIFSTYLYTGTGAAQSIVNNIDLTKGGLTWIKSRSAATNNNLFDTVQGATKLTHSNTTAATVTDANSLTAFSSTGFTLGTGSTSGNEVNVSGATYASWTFRKQPKFFDVVTYTGTGSNTTISHSLGSVPGMIIVKRTNAAGNWQVYHNSLTSAAYSIQLNLTAAQASAPTIWNSTAPTSSVFSVGTDATVNNSGDTYVAYIFASNAGGFGASGTDSAIACGSYTGTGSAGNFVSLGWEPQYVMIKDASSTFGWYIQDVMRGMSNTGEEFLFANTAGAATNSPSNYITPNATGFTVNSAASGFNASGDNFIYMAIRRPMKVPTDATTVFSPNVYTPASPQTVTTNFASDLLLSADNAKSFGGSTYVVDRLRGDSQTLAKFLDTTSTAAEATNSGNGWGFDNNTAIVDNIWGTVIGCTQPVTYWNFRRAPTFFDEVCYTGTGSATTQTHNLNVVPEMIIVKCRSASNAWWVYHSTTGNTKYSVLNSTAIPTTSSTAWNNTTPTSSVFSIGTGAPVNTSAATYVAYLFATCAGVSKVGSFTGTGGTQSIACGFGSGGARFVLIKRTDSTGDWYCFDSANGLTSSSSPYLKWNSTAAQTTGNNGCYASSGGFTLTSSASATVNVNGGSYIFLAIA